MDGINHDKTVPFDRIDAIDIGKESLFLGHRASHLQGMPVLREGLVIVARLARGLASVGWRKLRNSTPMRNDRKRQQD